MLLGQFESGFDFSFEAALTEQFAALDKFAQESGYANFQSMLDAERRECEATDITKPKGWTDQRTRTALPDTPTARVYAELPKIARYIATKISEATASISYRDGFGNDYRARAVEVLVDFIDKVAFNFPFERIASLDWKDALAFVLQRPIFTWDDSRGNGQIVIEGITLPIPLQQREPDGWSIHPAFALFFFGNPGPMAYSTYLRYSETFGFVWTDHFKNAIEYTLRNLLWGLRAGDSWGKILNAGSNNLLYADVGMMRCSASWVYVVGNLPQIWLDTYAPVGDALREQRRAERISDILRFVGTASAILGITGAIQSIVSQGLSITNAANLLTSVDRLPGVDFGKAGQIIQIAGRAFDPRSVVQTMGLSSLQDVASTEGMNMDVFESGFYEVTSPEEYWSGFDFGGFELPSFDAALDSLTQATSGFDFTNFVTDLAKTYAQYDLAKRALESQTGQRAPTQVTRPTPGTTRTLPDGSVAVTNADGSTTIKRPDGQVLTVRPSGQVVSGSGDIIPGVPNVVLLGGAALLLGGLLLARKR